MTQRAMCWGSGKRSDEGDVATARKAVHPVRAAARHGCDQAAITALFSAVSVLCDPARLTREDRPSFRWHTPCSPFGAHADGPPSNHRRYAPRR